MGNWQFVDNYECHDNGRIWRLWDQRTVEFKKVSCSSQYIHGKLLKVDGSFICWFTIIYALNQPEHRRRLWRELQLCRMNTGEAWCLAGDFNNILGANDRIGGVTVMPRES